MAETGEHRADPAAQPVVHVGLLWHSDNSGNLGVGALTAGNMALVERAAARVSRRVVFHLFKFNDPETPYITHGIVARNAFSGKYLVSPNGYWKALGAIDLMLDIGAGDSFTDIYPNKRFAYMILGKRLCALRGVPLILSPQTIGPFSRQPHTSLARSAMERALAVFARDPLSMDALKQIAPQARAFQAIDVAFALPFTQAAKGPGTRVGVNVSGLLYGGGYTGANEFGLTIDYRDFTHRFIEAMLARPETRVELICHVNAPLMPKDDDGAAADALKARYPDLIRVPTFASPSAAKSHISGLDFLVGARMHATIAAYSSGVPVLPVSYSRKFEGLYKALSYPWLVPAKGFSTDQAVATAIDAFDRREELAADISRGGAAVEKGLETYVGVLAETLASLKLRP